MARGTIADMHSLGQVTAKRLAEVGVITPDELRALGAVQAFRRLRFRFGRDITLNALYGLHAAVVDCHWRAIDQATKDRLKREAGIG
jgi:DNA transformation protein